MGQLKSEGTLPPKIYVTVCLVHMDDCRTRSGEWRVHVTKQGVHQFDWKGHCARSSGSFLVFRGCTFVERASCCRRWALRDPCLLSTITAPSMSLYGSDRVPSQISSEPLANWLRFPIRLTSVSLPEQRDDRLPLSGHSSHRTDRASQAPIGFATQPKDSVPARLVAAGHSTDQSNSELNGHWRRWRPQATGESHG
ncbi:hypothetical protein GY45DRAFT_1319863 [Cubamyces sp. BRFM 1775]|nr:hypothetical protein GY45DRAFT_1319863 [Cubamyces sp. BRFM 1775]